jgi:nucleotide sugar dehydrogenase
LIKYAANTLLATLISFSNEIANLCEILEGTDVERVMDGVHLDRRLSPYIDGERISPDILSYLRAGCGFGGSCLPKDLDALRNFVNHLGQTSPLLDAVAAVNRHRAIRMVDHAERLIGNLKGQAVSLLGLAFKPDTDDLRESPALAVIDELLNRGARVCAHDPVAVPAFRRLHDRPVETFDTAEAALEGAAAVLIVTAWPQYRELDWPTLVKSMDRPVIIDGRNILHDVVLPSSSVYQPMGRAPA